MAQRKGPLPKGPLREHFANIPPDCILASDEPHSWVDKPSSDKLLSSNRYTIMFCAIEAGPLKPFQVAIFYELGWCILLQSSTDLSSERPRLRGLDLLGVVLSGACLIHCTLLPLVLALLPVFGPHFHVSENLHIIITILIVPVAALALVTGWWKHRQNIVLVLGGCGLAMILGAPALHGVLGHLIAEVISALGGVLLIAGHVRNHKFLIARGQSCHCCH